MNINKQVVFQARFLIKSIDYIFVFVALLLLSKLAYAEPVIDENQKVLSVSIGFHQGEMAELTAEKKKETRLKLIEFTKEKSELKSKEQRMSMTKQSGSINRNKDKIKTKSRENLTIQPFSYDQRYSIYNAESFLLEDYDADGYYQTFSVVFDADVESYTQGLSTSATVYADLYMSKNGGPWEYYYSTDDFLIVGDREDDEFEVITTLHQAYYRDQYDILIELYETSSNDIVAMVSADDLNSLYALPLESTEFDEVETDVYISGGSFSWGVAALMMFILLYRKSILVRCSRILR